MKRKGPGHLVLARAQLHAAGSPATAAFPAAGSCVAAGSASDWPLAPLHGSFHS